MKQRMIYGIMAAGAFMGVAAAFLQTTEKIQLLRNKDAILTCDISSVFSCTNVLNAWQSSVFGFPNSLLCMILFTVFTTVALAGLSGGILPKGLRLSIQGLSLATLLFALWFLAESIFTIRSLCILCIFCFLGLLAVNWAWLRINARDLPLPIQMQGVIQRSTENGADTFGWILLALIVGCTMVLAFR